MAQELTENNVRIEKSDIPDEFISMIQKSDNDLVFYRNFDDELIVIETINFDETVELEMFNETGKQRPDDLSVIISDMKAERSRYLKQYGTGKGLNNVGVPLTCSGGFLIITGAVLMNANYNNTNIGAFILGFYVLYAGCIIVSPGIPLTIVGFTLKKSAINNFCNEYYGIQKPTAHFKINLNPGNVGIAYVF